VKTTLDKNPAFTQKEILRKVGFSCFKEEKKMKKIAMICASLLLLCLMVAKAFPAHYSSDVAPSTKTFVDTYYLPVGEQVTIDIYGSDVPSCQNAAGVWIDFSISTDILAYVSGGRAFSDCSEGPCGPWTAGSGAMVNEPAGPGTWVIVLGGIGGDCPDADGDLIIGRVVLEMIATGEASILFTTIPGAATWHPLADSDVLPHTLIITDDFDNDGIANGEDNCPETPNPLQQDTYPPQGNGIGDACDCEADFNCDGSVDAEDIWLFLSQFGRIPYFNPCVYWDPCIGDFTCDEDIDADDVYKFLEDFGRSQFFNPCPACEVGDWCVYP
jgi:hypothetical protein